MSLLQITGLNKRYGGFVALDGAELSVETGEFHGLIGPNGSGKSTFLKCIAGAHLPSGGSIEFAGQSIGTAPVRTGPLMRFTRSTPSAVQGTDPPRERAALRPLFRPSSWKPEPSHAPANQSPRAP